MTSPCPNPLIPASTTDLYGCPLSARQRIFNLQAGVQAHLQFDLRDGAGTPLNLADCTGSSTSSGDADYTQDIVKVRFQEALSNTAGDQLWQAAGSLVNANPARATTPVPQAVIAQPGIYNMEWGVFSDGNLVYSAPSFLLVNQGLFRNQAGTPGPPRLSELRLTLRDSDPEESQLLGTLEFDDAEIIEALLRPVRNFNETPPPLGRFNTTNFPYPEAWLRATQGYLFAMAANYFRRNQLQYVAGGMTVDDLNREQQYLQAAQLALQEWTDFRDQTKMSLNANLAYGSIHSVYHASPY